MQAQDNRANKCITPASLLTRPHQTFVRKFASLLYAGNHCYMHTSNDGVSSQEDYILETIRLKDVILDSPTPLPKSRHINMVEQVGNTSDHDTKMPDPVANEPEHTANKAHLRALLDDLAKDSDYNNPPRILRCDLLVIFLYLDDCPAPQTRFMEMEDEVGDSDSNSDSGRNTKSKNDTVVRLGPGRPTGRGRPPRKRIPGGCGLRIMEEESDDHNQVVSHALYDERSKAKREERSNERNERVDEGELKSKKRGEGIELDNTNSSTSWTDWFEIITRIAAVFPYYMRTMKPRGRPYVDVSRNPGHWTELWVEAFIHYETPFQRRVTFPSPDTRRSSNGACIQYRVNEDDAAFYLRSRGHLPALAPFPRSHPFNELPLELRVEIWKSLLTYPDSGVQVQYGRKPNSTCRMYTISRELHTKVSLGRYVEDKDDFRAGDYLTTNLTRYDQIIPDEKRSRMTTENLYKTFAPKTIHPMLRAEAKQVFLQENLFVFTSFDDAQVFLAEGAAEEVNIKRNSLRRVALVLTYDRDEHYEGLRSVYELLLQCVRLREVQLHFRSWCRRRREGDHPKKIFRKTFATLARHPQLTVVRCTGDNRGYSEHAAAALCVEEALVKQGSNCRTYRDEHLLPRKSNENIGEGKSEDMVEN